MLYLYKYHERIGRMGDLEGIFIVDERGKACVDALMESGIDVNFGEVLGKHSDVSCHYTQGELKPEDIPQEDIAAVLRVLGTPITDECVPWRTISGFNPLDYVDREGMAHVDGVWIYDRFLTVCKGGDLDEESEEG